VYHKIHLEHAQLSEVLARVAYRVVEREYRNRRCKNIPVHDTPLRCLDYLNAGGWPALHSMLARMIFNSRVAATNLRDARDCVIERSRQGIARRSAG